MFFKCKIIVQWSNFAMGSKYNSLTDWEQKSFFVASAVGVEPTTQENETTTAVPHITLSPLIDTSKVCIN